MENILENEGVSSLMVFVRSLERAWEAWRTNELDDDEVCAELGVLCDWLNPISEKRPTTEFWRKKF